ncbi:AAA domain-containing protein [Actinoplanes sp. NPDC024001]|uniref:AAA domain-containing protein n=1 Tax=Actinoplanes sp. NPDC024001 TaxID=3154598 RepID=UPI003408BACA
MPEALSLTDDQVISRTTGLVTYLRELAGPAERVRDAIDGNRVIWLDDYRDLIAAPGTPGLLEVRYPESEEPPPLPDVLSGRLSDDDPFGPTPTVLGAGSAVVEAAYRAWLPQWTQWADRVHRAAQVADRYRRLEELARGAVEQSDTHELVLGVGLLEHRTGIRRHLLTCEAELRVDVATETIRLVPPLTGGLRLEDRAFLTEADGFIAGREVAALLSEEAVRLDPLGADVADWLARWRKRCWRDARTTDEPAELAPVPALLLRPRAGNRLADFYESVAEDMRAGGAAPLGLAQLVTPMAPDVKRRLLAESQQTAFLDDAEPLLPLPTNQEQRRILAALRGNTAAVIQGPPGTGKTHTIANLICALLADGQRLLITSAKGQALRVLRDKLPPDIRDLCVLTTGGSRRGVDEELDRSITALSNLHAGTDLDQLRRDIDRLGRQRAELVQQRKNALLDLQVQREEEYAIRPDGNSGYSGTLLEIVRQIDAGRDRHEWIGQLPDTAKVAPPLTDGEAVELLALLRTADAGRAARGRQRIPDPALLPGAADIRTAFALLRQAAELTGPGPLPDLDPELAADAVRLIDRAADGLAEAGLTEVLADWDSTDWRRAAADRRLRRREPQYWEALRAELQPVAGLPAVLNQNIGVLVDTPQPGDAARLLGQARRLRAHLSGPGWFRFLRPSAAARSEAAELLRDCTVDGAAPTTVDELTRAVTVLEAMVVVENAERAWAQLGVPIAATGLRGRVARLLDIERDAAAVDLLATTRDEIERAFRRRGLRHAIRDAQDWDRTIRICRGAPLLDRARDAAQMIDQVIGQLSAICQDPDAAPEAGALIAALDRRDVSGCLTARGQIHEALEQQTREIRYRELMSRLRAGHPGLAEALAGSSSDTAWDTRLAHLHAAWAWGRATAYCRLIGALGRHDTEQALNDIETRLGDVTRDLAAASARLHCLSRVTESQRAALQDYRTHRSSLGRGKSDHRERRQEAARSAMREGRNAVPAWVMPLAEVVETMDVRPGAFDVVIVDEASQAGIDALFLLCLAPRVVIVGDDRQCAPGQRGELARAQDAIDYHLAGIPDHVRESFNPVSNLYELLSARFPGTIRLNEHFRCMPEIIGWSSRQFYQDRLLPLRQFGADRLDPLKVVLVPDAEEEGLSSNPVNRKEAQLIAEQVERMVGDPAYRRRTIGVVVLTQSTAQTTLISALIHERVDAAAAERHAIRVGQPPDFQGDERDVILMSMTIARPRPALAGRLHERRFNVAASRARDQLWLFLSVAATRLSPDDLRYSLISWMTRPPNLLTPDPAHDLAEPDVLRSPFTSLFHQQIYLLLRRRGFTVLVQHPISTSTIDLVVIGANGRLAVECESPERVTSPEQIQDNLRRDRELRRAGWQFVRLRHSAFVQDPDAALEPLWQRLRERGIEPGALPDLPATGTAWTPAPLSDREGEETAA